MNQIICIGNRLVPEDAAGLAVYDRLQTLTLPPAVTLVEGGLAGLNLLPLLENGGRVVFVDAVCGFAVSGSIVVLDQQTLIEATPDQSYNHNAGLPYLLRLLPRVCEGTMPEEIVLIGLEGHCNAEVIAEAAALSINLTSTDVRRQKAESANG